MSDNVDRMVEDDPPSPQRHSVGETAPWLSHGDSAEALAHRANQVNEELRRASGRVEQQVLEFVASMCGKTSLNPASMEFELSAYLATIEERSVTSDLAEHHLQQAQSFFVCSSMDRACQSLVDARSALGQSWEQILEINRAPSLPGTSESESSIAILHDRLVEHYSTEMHRCVAGNQAGGVRNAIERLSLLLPVEKIAGVHAAAVNFVLDGLLKTWSINGPGSSSDAAFFDTVQATFVDATAVAIPGFSRCVSQADWATAIRGSFAAPVHRFIDAAVSKLGASAAPLLLRLARSLGVAAQCCSQDEHRELSSGAVIRWLWERNGTWLKGQLKLLVAEAWGEGASSGIERDSARRGRHSGARSGGGARDARGGGTGGKGPWVEACQRATRGWGQLSCGQEDEPTEGYGVELAREVRGQCREYVARGVRELPGVLAEEGQRGGMQMLAGLLVLQRGVWEMAGAGGGGGDVGEEWDGASGAVVSAVGEVAAGVVGVVAAGWRDVMVAPMASLEWSANRQLLKRDSKRATAGLLLWNLALCGWARDALTLLPLDVCRRLLSSLLSLSLAAVATVLVAVKPSRLNMPQLLIDANFIIQVARAWEAGIEVGGRLLYAEAGAAGAGEGGRLQRWCRAIRATALLKACPLPQLPPLLHRISALRAARRGGPGSPRGGGRGGDGGGGAGEKDAMELGTPAKATGNGLGAEAEVEGSPAALRKRSCLESDGHDAATDVLEAVFEVGGLPAVFSDAAADLGEVRQAELDGLAHLEVLLDPEGAGAGAGVAGHVASGEGAAGMGMMASRRPGLAVEELVEERLDLRGSPFPPLSAEEEAAAAEAVAWCVAERASRGRLPRNGAE